MGEIKIVGLSLSGMQELFYTTLISVVLAQNEIFRAKFAISGKNGIRNRNTCSRHL